MAALMHDSITGFAIRFLTSGRVFQYAEEKDPSLWKQFANVEKSGRLAHRGRMDSVDIPEDDSFGTDKTVTEIPSVAWSQQGNRFQGLTGALIDPEKGKDVYLIDWWGGNDLEVCPICSQHTYKCCPV